MGGSVSKNATKIVVNSIAKISSKIVQDTKIGYDSSQIIYVKDTKGDVIIRGNKMIQKAYINMDALFNAMSSESAQQNLAIELAQSAKSLTSGLNIGQFSSAENDLEEFIQTSINLSTVISQSCAVLAQQEQRIIIEHTIGSVIIENNVFEQMANMFSSCIQTSISDSEALQSIILKLTQDSSATSKGLSEWVLIAIAAVFVGFPTIGVALVGKDILKYIFPLMFIAGTLMLVYYYTMGTPTIPIKAYSKFIENTNACLANPSHIQPLTSYESVEAAANYCNLNKDCKAFDWKGINVAATGSYKMVNPPQTKFYTSVSSDCRQQIGEDNVNLLRSPKLYYGSGSPPDNIKNLTIPTLEKGDIWIDTTTSAWYQLTTTWIKNNVIITEPFSRIIIQQLQPSPDKPGREGDYIITYDDTVPTLFGVYKYSSSRWVKVRMTSGPGYFAASPSAINSSGVKEPGEPEWLMYSGIAFIVIGLVGMTFVARQKPIR